MGKVDDAISISLSRGEGSNAPLLNPTESSSGSPRSREKRDDPEDRSSSMVPGRINRRTEEIFVPRNRLITKPAISLLSIHQNFHRSYERSEDASPVDVTGRGAQEPPHSGHLHVHDVMVLQMTSAGLPAPSRTITSNSFAREFRKPLLPRRSYGFIMDVLCHVHIPHGFPVESPGLQCHYLGLRRTGFIPHVRLDAACLSLNDLGPAHSPPSR